MKFIIIVFLFTMVAFSASTTQQIKDLEERILGLELENLSKNGVEINGDIRSYATRTNYVSRFYDKDYTNDRAISELRLRFNKTDLDRVKFYSAFGVTYLWNGTPLVPEYYTDSIAEPITGNIPVLYRAYLDFFMYDKQLALSVGRLPTQFGPPMHLSTDMPRQGTYPSLLYSIPFDGAALTMNLGKMLSTEDRYILRFIYKTFIPFSSATNIENAGINSPFYQEALRTGNFYSVNYEHSGRRSWTNFNFIFQYAYSKFEQIRAVSGFRGLLTTPGNPDNTGVYEIGSTEGSFVVQQAAIAYLELLDLFESSFDVYGSFKTSHIGKAGDLIAVVQDHSTYPSGTQINLGGFVYAEQQHPGTMLFLGTRYHLSPEANVGIEYKNETIGSVYTAARTLNFIDFYSMIGSGYHLYYNNEIYDDLTFSLGYSMLDYEGIFTGVQIKNYEDDANVVYTSLRYRF